MKLPPADFSLRTRGYEAGHAQRWQIYLLKMFQGAATAVALGLLWVIVLRAAVGIPNEVAWSSFHRWEMIALLGAATLAIVLAEKVVEDVTARGYDAARRQATVNPLDLLVDVALHQAWLLPWEYLNTPWLFIFHLVCFAAYPWSSE